jgi:RNA-directed DNA polymerase
VIAADYVLSKRGPRRTGTPQGGPISPLLSNVYLHPFDKQITGAGMRLVRYADDFVICCPSEARARQAWRKAEEELSQLHLAIHPEKTRILSCRDALQFLGHEFDDDGAFVVSKSPPGHAMQRRLDTGTQAVRRGTARVKEEGSRALDQVRERFGEIKKERKR